jgi:hypothetical protein
MRNEGDKRIRGQRRRWRKGKRGRLQTDKTCKKRRERE